MEAQFLSFIIHLIKELSMLLCLHEAILSDTLPADAISNPLGSHLLRYMPFYSYSISVSSSVFTLTPLYFIFTQLTNMPLTASEGSVEAIKFILNALYYILSL